MRKGIPVSPGVAVGRAYCVHEIFIGGTGRVADDAAAQAEWERFEAASKLTAADLRALYQKVSRQVGEDEAAIFRSHEAILHDQAFSGKVAGWIVSEHLTAPAALARLLEEYTALFARTEDEYLRERLTDVRDVIERLSGHLSPALASDFAGFSEPVILVANELLPSQVVTLGERQVAGIVTQAGGRTSHAAILARSRGIPAVSGLRGVLKHVRTGDLIVVDGRDGAVIIGPSAEVESAYRKLQREFVDLQGQLAANRDQPAVSADGAAVELLANVNHLADAQTAAQMGAVGVGLYRTEYLFLTHPDVPDEEEQLAAYQRIIAASPQRRVTIRTLDLGGDKTIPYLGHDREANPFMGWRSIRLSFEHPEFFATQIRAILRAGASAPPGQVRLLFPMITTLEELRRVRGMVRRARRQLEADGLPFADVPIGLMLEVPAAALTLDSLLEVVDFVSIGSNDLVQYLMAADRDNPKVSHLCEPLSPAVLKLLADVLVACREGKRPVTLCGEMAGSLRGFLLLFGLGLRSFSMSPAFVPRVKELVHHLTVTRAEEIAREALTLRTSGQIRRFLGHELAAMCPSLKLLDSD